MSSVVEVVPLPGSLPAPTGPPSSRAVTRKSAVRGYCIALAVLAIEFGAMCITVRSFCTMVATEESAKDQPPLSFPHDLKSLQALHGRMRITAEHHFMHLLLTMAIIYTFKQTFCLPGSFILNLAMGALLGQWIGLATVMGATVLGTSVCYFLAHHVGHAVAEWKPLAPKLKMLERKVSTSKENGTLFWTLLSLRMFPLTPQWLINVAAPLTRVPWTQFTITVLIGLLPYNYLVISAGTVLMDLSSTSEVISTSSLVQLAAIATAFAIIPIIVRRRTATTASANVSIVEPESGACKMP